jgi:SH3-like domain-containing protein
MARGQLRRDDPRVPREVNLGTARVGNRTVGPIEAYALEWPVGTPCCSCPPSKARTLL